MSVAQASADTFPYVCAVYVCRCGRRATSHGADAGRLPREWLLRGRVGHREPVCPDCAPAAAAPHRVPSGA